MKIKTVHITNYRKIIDAKINMEDNITVICLDKYVEYLDKPGVTKARECLKENSVLGILSAYKLFYVGCSRARRNLTILLDRSKLQGDVPWQKEKFKELGFSVEEIFV